MRFLFLLFFPVSVFAQSGSVEFDMPWSPQVNPAFLIVPVRTSATGVVSEIAGQAQPINLSVARGITNEAIVVFPGQKTAMVVTGFRVKGTVKASWTTDVSPTQMVPTITVPAGKGFAVRARYSLALMKGTFEWAPDIASLPTPVQPPILPTPQPVPPPVCTTMPPATTLTDNAGHVFTPLPSEPGTTEIGLSMDGVKQFGAIVKAYLLNGQVCADDSKSPGVLGSLVCFVSGVQKAVAGPSGC